jgi:hypothetical protein
MADVFISYKREDRAIAEGIADHLQSQGFTTWWDTDLVAGEQFNEAIERELAAANAVVVVWSEASHASRYVQAEAINGFTREILVAARVDDVILKYPYPIIQTADLGGWSGTGPHKGLADIANGVARMLEQSAGAAIGEPPSSAAPTKLAYPITGVVARPTDPSIWNQPESSFQFMEPDGFSARWRDVVVPDGHRAFIRLIPASWTSEVPPVHEVEKLFRSQRLSAPSDGYSAGSWGNCEVGAVAMWFAPRASDGVYEAENVTMFFDETGELWTILGSAFTPHKGETFFRSEATLRAWSVALRQGVEFLDQHGAHPARKIVAGISGPPRAMWALDGNRYGANPQARKAAMTVEQEGSFSDQKTQQQFLMKAINRLRNNFSLPTISEKEFLELLKRCDGNREIV